MLKNVFKALNEKLSSLENDLSVERWLRANAEKALKESTAREALLDAENKSLRARLEDGHE